ncbi:uncharacterized protein [Manis javanica]|uniref:uncharacterized protein isoform X1 n=2 Tax=Manis javanica TaxID=9974 RepID=UPI003C6D445B
MKIDLSDVFGVPDLVMRVPAGPCGVDVQPVEARDMDMRPVEARGVDVRPVEARGVDVRPVEARDVDMRPVEARGVDVRPVEARGVDVRPVEARDVDMRPVEARGVDVRPVEAHSPEARRWAARLAGSSEDSEEQRRTRGPGQPAPHPSLWSPPRLEEHGAEPEGTATTHSGTRGIHSPRGNWNEWPESVLGLSPPPRPQLTCSRLRAGVPAEGRGAPAPLQDSLHLPWCARWALPRVLITAPGLPAYEPGSSEWRWLLLLARERSPPQRLRGGRPPTFPQPRGFADRALCFLAGTNPSGVWC